MPPMEPPVVIAEPPKQEAVDLFPEAARMPLYWKNLLSQAKVVIDQGGMYSGKTEAIMRVLFTIACIFKNLIIHVVANTVPKLKEDTMKVAERIVTNNEIVQHFLLGKFNITEREYRFRNGSVISFKAYATAEEAEGAKRDIMYINEGRRIPWSVAYLLIKRTNGKVFIDYNPVARFWAHDEIIFCPEVNGKKEFPSVEVIRSWHIHNDFLSEEKHAEIENIVDVEMWKAYARGLTAQLSGLVYPNWTKVPADFIDTAPDVIWGLDLGFTNDPTVVVKCAVNYKGYDYVFKAFGYVPGLSSAEIGRIMTEANYQEGEPLYMDHKKTTRLELRQLRIQAINAFKGPGSEEEGILHLRKKRVAFCEESGALKEYGLEYEIRRHMFAELKTGKRANKGENRFKHGPDACRYAAYSHAVRYKLIQGHGEDPEEEPADDEDETMVKVLDIPHEDIPETEILQGDRDD